MGRIVRAALPVIGTAIGTALGFAVGGPLGAQLGALIGGGLGTIGASGLSPKPRAPRNSPANIDRLRASLDPLTPRKTVIGGPTAMRCDIR